MRLSINLLLLVSLPFATLASADALTDAGQAIVMKGDGSGAPCLACHGMDGAGNDAAGFPRLAGLNAGYLAKQIYDYRDGKRESAIMMPNVDNLTDEQITAVAAYYAGQQVTLTPAAAPPDLLALGEKLVKEGMWDNYIVPCETCHGRESTGVADTFPALAGQHATYIKQQLMAWKNGTRSNDPNQLMLAIAGRLDATQIEAVAAYLASLPFTSAQGEK